MKSGPKPMQTPRMTGFIASHNSCEGVDGSFIEKFSCTDFCSSVWKTWSDIICVFKRHGGLTSEPLLTTQLTTHGCPKYSLKNLSVMIRQKCCSLLHLLGSPFQWLTLHLLHKPAFCSHVHSCCQCTIRHMYFTAANCMRGVMALWMFLFMAFSTGTLCYLAVKTHINHMSYIEDNRIMCTAGSVESMALTLIQNYTKGHKPFLEPGNYFWVKSRSTYRLPFGTKGNEDLLLSILAITTNYNLPPEILSLPCKTCVVVGNGHRLQNSSLGLRINKYDVVIRINNAPVRQYQEDVGNKTTMRLFYPESANFDPLLENNPDTLMVLVPFKPLDLQWLKSILNNEKRPVKGFWKKPPLLFDVKPSKIRILNPYFMQLTAGKLLNISMKPSDKSIQNPTSGLLAITFALHFCDVVHIAGFGYPEITNHKSPIHYYEKTTLQSMAISNHNISHETRTIKMLLDAGIIKNLTVF